MFSLVNINSIININLPVGDNGTIKSVQENNDYYGGSLLLSEMQKTLHGLDCYDLKINDISLPYTIEIPFFDFGENNISALDTWDCAKGSDLVISYEDHPLNGESLKKELKKAYKSRRWDELDSWINRSLDHSRSLIRIESIDIENKKIVWAKTSYATQAVTNLVMDLKTPDKKSLRWLTKPAAGLPALSDRRLANNLGISILIIGEDGKPIFPLRADKGVAIFPNEWGASLSTAAKLHSGYHIENLRDLVLPAIRDMFKEEFFTESRAFEDRLIPLAICREWFRGGKPQLFLAYESDISLSEAARRLGKAEHSDELHAKSGLRNWLINMLTSNHARRVTTFKSEKEKFSIEALANFALYEKWKSA